MQTGDSSQQSGHAHLVQMLSALMVQVNALQSLVRDEDTTTVLETLREGLATLEQLTRETLHEARSFDEDVPLAELIGVTLTEALSHAVEEAAETLGLSSRITFSGEEYALPGYVEGLLYRIAQEALYQVQQHSGTRRLRLVFTYGRDEVQMSIEDDGTPASEGEDAYIPPFVFNAPMATDAVLNDLRHRVEHLGGSLEIMASTEEGSRVRVRVPHVQHPDTETEIVGTLPGGQVSRFIEGPTLAGARSADGRSPVASPVSASPAGAGSTRLNAELPRQAAPPDRVRVLVVEAQAVTRAGLRRLLESYPDLQVVGEAADGVQAVSETLELGPQVVLMDMQLPAGQSMEALRQIKQLNLDTQVLMLSALDREDYLYETLRAGAGGYVLKDIAPDELAQAVRTVARGEVLVQPQLARRLLLQFGRQSRGGHPYESLTAREQEVLRLLARGLRNKEMAARLHVSERTINFHLANIYQKLNVSGRTEALSKALEQGLITA
jgi:DNA-binding NarL/FixJ family response regulator